MEQNKVVIEINDQPDGSARVVMNPSFEQLMKKIDAGYSLSAAETYACRCARAILEMNKELRESGNQSSLILVPRTGR